MAIGRERISGSTRRQREAEEDEDEAAARVERIAPGKLTLPRVDRRAALGRGEPDDGALAAAFGVITEARDARRLPPELCARFSDELGIDASAVWVHVDDRAARAATMLGARAFTIGHDIYFAAGAYDPDSAAGIELIAHEVAHVAQSLRGTAPRDGRRVSRHGDAHEQQADEFASQFAERRRTRVTTTDPAELVEHVRREGQRMNLPFLAELEEQLGHPLGFVEAYTGEAAQIACRLMAAGAFAVRNIVAFADPSPQRDQLVHELTHVVQMGSTRAPGRFAPGALRVGDADAPAERDARAVIGGGQIRETASPDVIHRDTGTPPATAGTGDAPGSKWTAEKATERWTAFHPTLKPRGPDDSVHVFYIEDGDEPYRYASSSRLRFSKVDYEARALYKLTEPERKKKDATGDEVDYLNENFATTGLVKAEIKYGWVDPADAKIRKVVLFNDPTKAKMPAPLKFGVYIAAVHKLKAKYPALAPSLKLTMKRIETCDFTETGDVPKNDYELKKARNHMVKAIAALDGLKWKDGQWTAFFEDIVEAGLFSGEYNRIAGEIFGQLAAKDLKDAGVNITQQETFFYSNEFAKAKDGKTKRAGDGFVLDGGAITLNKSVVDFKSGQPDGPSAEELQAAQDFALIIRRGLTSTTIEPAHRSKPFKHVLYVFTKAEIATAWVKDLAPVFASLPAGTLKIIPTPTDTAGLVNVEVEIPTGGAPVQKHAVGAASVHDPAAVRDVAASGVAGPAASLPHLGQIQSSFGDHDLSSVGAHVGGPAASASDALGAGAYAVGDQVAFRDSPDVWLAAHEAAHVVQQSAGVALSEGVGAAGDHYEQVADAVADRAVAGKSASDLLPAGHGSGEPAANVQLKFNPTFTVPLKDKNARTHKIVGPPIAHPGTNIQEVTIETAAPGSADVTGGNVILDVTLGEAAKGEHITKPLQPGGTGKARADNKLTGLSTTLSKILKGVETDARLTDSGVEATIKIASGVAKIGKLALDESAITVRYGEGGQLAVSGEVHVNYDDQKYTGTIIVGWDGGEWSFTGKVAIAAGVVEGLAAFEASVSYGAGKWTLAADRVAYSRAFGAVTIAGSATGVTYDVDKGEFSGSLAVEADLGMFGKAGAEATLEKNKLARCELSYDSPEFKYPAKKEPPAFRGTVGGTVTYNDGKFSGGLRGTANINAPALKKIAGDKGIGLAVNAIIHEDGSYSGTIATSTPLKLGKYLEIPKLACTIERDGALTGDFAIKIVNIKHLEKAEIACVVDKSGITVKAATVTVTFGDQEKGKFWGSLTAGYSEDKGLDIGGSINYKIKDDMIATGTLKYQQGSNAVTLEMKVSEITLIDKTVKKTLFKASKQIPIVNVYGLGIYVDIGFDLGFDFGFKITMTPEVDFIGLSLDTWQFERIAAKLKVGGDVFAQLTGTPKLGIGVFALDPSIIRGGGGLKVPIVGRLDIKPSGEFGVGYKPDGGVTGSAKLGLAGQFGITGSLKPYAEFAVLNNMWNPTWEGEALAAFEILKPKELFNFTVDLAGDKAKDDDGPKLPEENAAKEPTAPAGDKTQAARPSAPEDKGGDANKGQAAKQGEVAESGEQGPFSLDGLLGKFQSNPTVATATKIFNWAKKVWKVIKPIYDIVEPIVNLIGKRIEAIIDLFDIDAPTGDNVGPWLWKLAGKLFNVAFGGLADIANAIKVIFGAASAFAQKFITKSIKDGQIGVKRHSFYIWRPWPLDNYEFMAADEYKVIIPGIADLGHHGPSSFLLEPSGAVALVLYQALEAVGIGYSYVGKSDINQPYNDIWYGGGARG